MSSNTKQLERIVHILGEIDKLTDDEKRCLHFRLPFCRFGKPGAPDSCHQQILCANCSAVCQPSPTGKKKNQALNSKENCVQRIHDETAETYRWILFNFEEDPKVGVLRSDLYCAYRTFCRENRLSTLYPADLNKLLKYAFPQCKICRMGKYPAFFGIKKKYDNISAYSLDNKALFVDRKRSSQDDNLVDSDKPEDGQPRATKSPSAVTKEVTEATQVQPQLQPSLHNLSQNDKAQINKQNIEPNVKQQQLDQNNVTSYDHRQINPYVTKPISVNTGIGHVPRDSVAREQTGCRNDDPKSDSSDGQHGISQSSITPLVQLATAPTEGNNLAANTLGTLANYESYKYRYPYQYYYPYYYLPYQQQEQEHELDLTSKRFKPAHDTEAANDQQQPASGLNNLTQATYHPYMHYYMGAQQVYIHPHHVLYSQAIRPYAVPVVTQASEPSTKPDQCMIEDDSIRRPQPINND